MRCLKTKRFTFKVAMLIGCLWLPFTLCAKPITEKQAMQLAADFFCRKTVRTVQIGKTATAQVRGTAIGRTESATDASYYVFTPEGNTGFVIISGDDELKPVIGYSATGRFDVARIPAQLTAYLDAYEKGIEMLRQHTVVQGRTVGGRAVAPLLTTQWNQDEPYNLQCGKYGDKYMPAGCVAVAVAQVMKYHNFPAKGNGVTDEMVISPSTDLSQSVYNWNKMRDTYEAGTYNDAEAEAVALLMRDVGRALWTYYTPESSSAFSAYIAPALHKHFNYSKDARLLMRDYYTSQNWMDIIRENLTAGQPVVYCGSNVPGNTGHVFVCDGIDENDYLHINWGWSGNCDGYFDINAFAPYGTDDGEYTYYAEHQMVVGIHPGDPEADNAAYESPLMVWGFKLGDADYMDYFYHSPQLDENGRLGGKTPLKFRLYYNLLNNTRATTNYDEYLIYGSLYDENKQLIKRFDISNTIRGRIDRDKYREHCCLFDFTDVPAGNYYVSLWYKRDQDRNGTYVDKEFDFACEPFFPVTVKDGGLYFESADNTPDAKRLEIISAEQAHPLYEKAGKGLLRLAIRNNGKEVFKDEDLSIWCAPENEAADSPDISTLTKVGNMYIGAIYDGATVMYSGFVSNDLGAGNYLGAGRYRLYFSYRANGEDVLVSGDKKYYFDVTPLPDHIPFVLTQPLTLEFPAYENSDHEWMKIGVQYMPTGHCTDFWNSGSRDVQFWAAPVSSPENKFLLFESLGCYLIYNNYRQDTSMEGSPDLLWKTPGEYRVWLKTRAGGTQEWMDIDLPNNTGTFTVTEYQPLGPALYLTAPMAFENGNNHIKPGSEFSVAMKVKSPTGINMLLDNSFAKITETTASPNGIGYARSIEADKTELAPGEETEMRVNFYLPDNAEFYGKRLMVMVYVNYEVYLGEYVNPGNYLESISFTADPSSGINDTNSNGAFKCNLSGNALSVQPVGIGDKVELWSAAGILIKRCQTRSDRCEMAVSDLAPGVYIVKVHSADHTCQSAKIAIQ